MGKNGPLGLKISVIITLVIGILMVGWSLFLGVITGFYGGIWLIFFLPGLIPLVIGIILLIIYLIVSKLSGKKADE